MKLGLICDMHLPDSEKSPQWQFFIQAVSQLREDNIETVVNLGDTTSFGEFQIFCRYREMMKPFDCYTLLGNSDVRDKVSCKMFLKGASSVLFKAGKINIAGINTPYGKIEERDRTLLNSLSSGDILLMHHSIAALETDSRDYINALTKKVRLTIIHAHSHKHMDYMLGLSRVVCLRALDPDKSIGNFPCITYYDTETEEFSEKVFSVSQDTIADVKKYFGISCKDSHEDIDYAIKNNVCAIELRCNGKGWEPDYSLLPKIEQWRKNTNGYLSIHMPNLCYKDGCFSGKEEWYRALEFAKRIGADGLTMHPPRVSKSDFEMSRDEFLNYYLYAAENVLPKVNIGLENIHMGVNESDNMQRGFGYTPDEINKWIDSINHVMDKNRIGHTLDVGHARNNGSIAEKFPISRWYELMGEKIVAFHIHQVIPGDENLMNHKPIENWFGPMISYVSFFYCWEKGIINHSPVFFEMNGWRDYEKSVEAFNKCFL